MFFLVSLVMLLGLCFFVVFSVYFIASSVVVVWQSLNDVEELVMDLVI